MGETMTTMTMPDKTSPSTGDSRQLLDRSISAATGALLAAQRSDGHWVFELEADATIPAEYVLLRHYLGEPVDAELEGKIANYLRRIQAGHGGWPLFHEGDFDMSASVKAYFALKMIGDDPEAAHMRRAREAIRQRGGAAKCNVFTRALLALYGVVSWRAVPVMPVEIMLLPYWFPLHLNKMSYWARTVIAPLLVLGALKPKARNPKKVGVDELFLEPPQTLGLAPRAPHQSRAWSAFFSVVDAALARRRTAFSQAIAPARDRRGGSVRQGASQRRRRSRGDFSRHGQFGDDVRRAGLRSSASGLPRRAPLDRQASRRQVRRSLLPALRLPGVGHGAGVPNAAGGRRRAGDGRGRRGTEMVAAPPRAECRRRLERAPAQCAAGRLGVSIRQSALPRSRRHRRRRDGDGPAAKNARRRNRFRAAIERAREWICGLQSGNGGWGAFDADNNFLYLNNIPFSDHGALLDPPTEDVTGRCVSMLAQLGERPEANAQLSQALGYLSRTQLADGSWYGRWGMNYIYGTWSALCALNMAGVDRSAPEMARAADWLAGDPKRRRRLGRGRLELQA